ncbi:response regulator transcription factor [Rheinheimera sp.]|uniref:LytR/AlgR family response regulator transcription factor n=1 Tax=Rheinheimera sp. TaxID=1869214 RepID=UPI00307D449C
MLKLLIVDDEPLAHQVISHLCLAHSDIEIAGHCYSAAEALTILARQRVDVLVLDIQMPVLTGLDMLRVMQKKPAVILCSAYQQYALDGFDLDVADYLLKPVSAERFSLALQKIRRRLLQPQQPTSIVLKVERAQRRFLLTDICCFEAYGNYVKVWQGQQMVLVNSTLKQVYDDVAAAGFVQVHKSFLVNKQHVISQDCTAIQLSNQRQIKVGSTYRAQLTRLL